MACVDYYEQKFLLNNFTFLAENCKYVIDILYSIVIVINET